MAQLDTPDMVFLLGAISFLLIFIGAVLKTDMSAVSNTTVKIANVLMGIGAFIAATLIGKLYLLFLLS